MNNRGQGLILGIMLFVMAFIVAVILTKPIMDFTDEARDADHLNCDADNVTNGVLMTCLVIDLVLPFFIATVIVSGTAYFFWRGGSGGG